MQILRFRELTQILYLPDSTETIHINNYDMQSCIWYNIMIVCFRMAIKYIKHLQYLLSYPPHQKIPSHIVEFDPAHPAWVKAGSGLHPHLLTTAPFETSLDMSLMELDGDQSSDNVWISAGSPASPTAVSGAIMDSPKSPESSPVCNKSSYNNGRYENNF
jgi:hypothetical protein